VAFNERDGAVMNAYLNAAVAATGSNQDVYGI